MPSQIESQKIVDSYLAQLEPTKIINLKHIFLGREQTGEMLNTAVATSSSIAQNISSLSDGEKEKVKEYLQNQINTLDGNFLSRLSKVASKKEIPSFVYFVFGSIIAICFTEILKVPFSVVLIIFLVLISCLMFFSFSNSKNRYLYNYLLNLFDS